MKNFMKKINVLLALLFIFVSVEALAQNAHELSLGGSPISGNLSSGEEIWYSIRVVEPSILTIETLGETDTYLEAYDARQNLITEDDDGGEGANARIEMFVAAGDTYLFKLRGYSDETSGPYRILAASNPIPEPTELRLGGSPISGNLSPGEEIWYSIQVVEPSILAIETLGETDTYLEAYDAWRNLITEDDDGGEGYNARIEMFVATGRTYLFKLRGYSGEAAGPYRILATRDPVPEPAELRFGTARKGTVDTGTKHWYSVRAEEKGFITAETFGKTDTYLEVYDPQYNLVTEDDDGGIGFNAFIEVWVEPEQVLLFRLRGINNETIGEYEIVADFYPVPVEKAQNTERSGAVGINLGEAVPVFFHGLDDSRWYRYEIPRDGTKFAVQTRGKVDTILFLYDQNGNLVASDDDSGENLNAFIFERLNAGVYFIEVKSLFDSPGRSTLHAETR